MLYVSNKLLVDPILILKIKVKNFTFQSDFANAALASINQILSSKQGKALTGPNADNVEEDLRNNPYFQHMIENYANLIQQQQQQQRHLPQLKQQHQNNGPTSRPAHQGPSWC